MQTFRRLRKINFSSKVSRFPREPCFVFSFFLCTYNFFLQRYFRFRSAVRLIKATCSETEYSETVKWWNRTHKKNWRTWIETCSNATLSKTGLKWTGVRSNPNLSYIKIEINLIYIHRCSSYRAVNSLHLIGTKQLMLCRKTVAVCSEIPALHVNTRVGRT